MSKKEELDPLPVSQVKYTEKVSVLLGIPAILLTFLLPVKFGSISAIPEVAMDYPGDIASLIIVIWPLNVFFLVSGVLLLAVVLFIHKPIRFNHAFFMSAIWLLLGLVCFIGFIHASCFVFPLIQCIHMLGIIAYGLAVYLLLQANPGLKKWFILAIILGTAVSIFWGIEQYLYGLKETQDFVYQQELKSGIASSYKFQFRLKDGRIFATFSLCNSFAAHLILTIPLCCWWVWRYAGRVEPPNVSRGIFVSVTVAVLFFMLYLTVSRAAILAFGMACIGILLLMPLPRKILIPAFFLALLVTAAGFVAVQWGRDLLSIQVRKDYYTVATKMFLGNFLTGSGWGDFFHDFMLMKEMEWDEAPHTPHNIVLSFASQTGVAGLFCCILALFYPFWVLVGFLRRKFTKRLKSFRLENYVALFTDFRFAVLVGWTAWALHSCADINLQIPGTVATAIVLVLIALPRTQPLKVLRGKVLRYRFYMPVLLLLSLTVVPWSWHMIKAERSFGELQDYCDPRFKEKDEFMTHTMYGMQSRLDKCTKTMPYSPFPYATAADFAAMKGFMPDAEFYLSEAIKRSPARSSFYWKLGRIQLFMRKFTEADRNFRKAQSLFPRHPKYSKYPGKEAFTP